MPTPTTASNATNVSPANSQNIDALLGLIKWGGGAGTGVTLSYSFPWAAGGNAVFAGPGGIGSYSTANEQNAAQHYGLNATQQAGARAALQSWANVANISFQEVADTTSSVGDIRIAFSSAVGSQWWGYAYYPDSYSPSGGDIWISTLSSGATDPNWASGSYNYFSLIHEIGHALGLKHPFEGPVLLPTALDNRVYSVMSYTDPTNGLFRTITSNPDGSFSFNYIDVAAETPMVLDIAAIQYLYGANMTYRTGNDVYSFSATTPFFKTIWDAGGNDTISVSNFTENCRIDLTPGNYSSIRIVSSPLPPGYTGGTLPTYDGTNNLGIAYGAIIENAKGGSGADTLIGNNANNNLDGGAGNDTMTGGAGNDILNGGSGNDTLNGGTGIDWAYYNTATAGVTVNLNLTTAQATGGAGSDTLSGIENLLGSNYNDVLTGNSLANTLSGGNGVDTLVGGLGNDTYVVDNASDITTETSALVTEIDTVQSSVSRALGINLENLVLTGTAAINGTGNALNNAITGNAAANMLNGSTGNDILNGGTGNDTLTGGTGSDWAYYNTATTGVTVNLNLTTAQATGGAGSDTLSGIENLLGSNYNDVLTGNSLANTLSGGKGADTLVGGLGNDTYVVDNAADVTTETSALATEIDTVQSSVSRTLGINLENLVLTGTAAINGTGNALNNTITGNAAANTLNGSTGNDILNGGAGNDTLTGGTGIDWAYYSTATASVTVNLNSTTAQAASGAGSDTLSGIENLLGSIYNDVLTGNSLANTLNGSAGNDILNGDAGGDVLNGGLGKDTLTGGLGSDIFDFNAITESVVGTNRDVITDFMNGVDKIDLTGIDANTQLAGNQAFTLIAGTAAFSAAGQAKCTGGILYCEVNGDAVADFQISLTGVATMTAADFML